jgi:hypothetical protein
MKKSDLITLLVSVSLSFLFAELVLRKFTQFPLGLLSNKAPHSKLGYVMDTAFPEIDSKGFRNHSLVQPDVITIGDSHTYGFNVFSEQSWPKVLAKKLGKEVYNYGIGGYGVLHYDYLMSEAVSLKPKVVLVALYLPNDLADVCALALSNPYWFNERVDLQIDRDVCNEYQNKKKLAHRDRANQPINWLKKNVALYSALSDLLTRILPLTSDKNGLVVDHGKTKIKYRKIRKHEENMNIELPHIKMSLNVLKLFMLRANELANLNSIDFAVLFIPSKERVYYDQLIAQNTSLPGEYRQLVQNVERLKAEISAYMDNMGVRYADVLPSMQDALNPTVSLYSSIDDSHPVELGYQIYAEKAYELYQGLADK